MQHSQEHSVNIIGMILTNIDLKKYRSLEISILRIIVLEKYLCERDFDGQYFPTDYFNSVQIVINHSHSASEYVKDQSCFVNGILNGRGPYLILITHSHHYY